MQHERNLPRASVVTPTTWLASFGIASVLGIALAYQSWASYRGLNGPPFWDGRVIQPLLIPWLVWAPLAPLLMMVFERTEARGERLWRRLTLYALIAAAAVVLHAAVSGLALGWWWSFPSFVPIDPAWHIRDLLRTRGVISLLVFALIAAVYHVRATRVARSSPPSTPALPHPPDPSPPQPRRDAQSPIALKTADRVVFVHPRQIDWVEADRDHVIVHAGDVRHRVRDTISAMERRLPADQLIRVSRSAIVNVSAIIEMQPWFRGDFVIILRDGSRVQTGKKYRERITRLM